MNGRRALNAARIFVTLPNFISNNYQINKPVKGGFLYVQ
jgi:hypothetical protein